MLDHYELEFVLMRSKDGTQEITKTGHAFEVFAGVKVALVKFIKEIRPKSFSFSAKEVSRKKLYKKMVGPIEKLTGYKLSKELSGLGTIDWMFIRI